MIVVGYTADAFGIDAVEHAIAEAALRGTGLLVINATSGQAYVDSRFARSGQVHDVEERLRESGVPVEVAVRRGMIHDFLRMPAVTAEAQHSRQQIADLLRKMPAGQPREDFSTEAPSVYFGSTMLPSRTRPAWVRKK